MASPTVTYSFTNGTVIDASQVNTNFNDIIASLTDSTKDLDVADISATTGTITNLTSTAATLTTGTIGTLKNTVTDVASTATINAMVNTTSYIRITGTTATTINGITAGTAGQIIHIESVSANLTFAHQSGSASGVNRLYCPTAIDFGVGAPCSVSLIYNGTALGWVVLANTRTNTVTIADGSATAPSLNFTGTSSNTGIYLLTTDSFAFAANGAYVGNFLGTGTSTQWNFGSATSGQFTFRSDGAQPVFNYNSNANFSSLATETYMYSGTNSQALRIAGGNTSVAGGSLRLYGGTHATKADVTEFYNAGVNTVTISAAGLVTIGDSGGTQTHAVNGSCTFTRPIAVGGIALAANSLATLYNNTTYTLTTTTQYGLYSEPAISSAGTAAGHCVFSQLRTEAAAFTVALGTSFYAGSPQKGAGSTITRYVDFLSQSGTGAYSSNTARLADNTSFTGDWFINQSSTLPSTFGGYLQVNNQADPGAVTDGIRIGSVDLSAGNATLSLRTERAVAVDVVLASTHTLSVQINGTTYKILLST
jgi:hypothetical protein